MRGAMLGAIVGLFAVEALASQAGPVALPSRTIHQTIEGVSVAVPIAATATLPPEGQEGPVSLQLRGDLSDIQAKFPDIISRVRIPDEKCGDRLRLTDATLMPAAPDALATATVHYERWFCHSGLKLKTKVVSQKGDVCVTAHPTIVDDTEIRLESSISCVNAHGFAKAMVAVFQQQLADLMTRLLRDAIGGDKLRFALPPEILRFNPRILTTVFVDRGNGSLGAFTTAEVTLDKAALAMLRAQAARQQL